MLKRLFDMTVALALLIMLAPLICIIICTIRLSSQGSVFYIRPRVGYKGRLFPMYKFRTMIEGAENQGLGIETAVSDPRITRVGAFLRRWSFDELPQLWNVLRGDMSLIGPRPSLPEQVARYTSAQRHRLDVRPGLTGWAQVNGRNSLSWNERIELDCWYIDHWSWQLDWLILRRTLQAIIASEGVYGRDGYVRDVHKDES